MERCAVELEISHFGYTHGGIHDTAWLLRETKQTTHSMYGALLAQPERHCLALSLKPQDPAVVASSVPGGRCDPAASGLCAFAFGTEGVS
jgi:hypothetical protein